MRFFKYFFISLFLSPALAAVTGYMGDLGLSYYPEFFTYLFVVGLYAIVAEMYAEYHDDLLRTDYDEKIKKLEDRIKELESKTENS